MDQQSTNKTNKKSEKEEKCIKKECKHEWIDDLIDLDPDRAKTIYYCVICLATKE